MVLRCVPRSALQKILRRVLSLTEIVLQWVLEGGGVLRRVLRRDSENGLQQGTQKAETCHFREYDPLGMRP